MKPNTKLLLLLILLVASTLHVTGATERTFVELKASDGLADNSAQTIKCTLTGRMVVTTIGNINFYDGTNFSHVNSRQEQIFPLSNYHGHYHLYFDKMHHLWLKSSSGVSCVNLTSEQYISNVDSVFKAMGMKEKVTDMFVDQNGVVWMEGKDFIFNSKGTQKFPVLAESNLQDLDVYKDQRLLMFYDNGELMEFDVKTEQILRRSMPYGPEDQARYYRSSVILLYQDCYYQIRNGEKDAILLRYDMKSQQWSIITRMEYHLNNMAIYDNILYIASEYGYWTYDIASGSLKHEESLTLSDGRELITDVNTIEFDHQGGMWIGTERRGLLYSRLLTMPFKTLTWDNPLSMKYEAMMAEVETDKIISEFNGKKANCMFLDSRNWTWVGTPVGLYLFKNPQDEPVYISRRSGLLNNVIHAIIEDNRHNIWVSTSYGISCVVLKGDSVRMVTSYNQLDNVPDESFVNGRAIKLDDGTIVMQALDHVVLFNPSTFKLLNHEQTLVLYPKLTRVMVNGNNVVPGELMDGNMILDRAVSRSWEINLNSDQNSVSLTFSGLNYVRPLHTYYRVRVKGIIDEWQIMSYYNSNGKVDRNGQLHLPLTGMPPGDYNVELQVSIYPDEWKTRPYVWTIHVREPWWHTTGLYVIMGLVLLALLIVNFILFNRNTRLRMRRNSDEGDIIRRILSFVDRCDGMENEALRPTHDEMTGDVDENNQLSPAFIEAMAKVVPFVHEQQRKNITMRKLSMVTGIDVLELYDIVTPDLYKSPRMLVTNIRLEKAAEMLKQADMTLEKVTEACNFASPNFFIANFYHKYKMTPADYKKSNT